MPQMAQCVFQRPASPLITAAPIIIITAITLPHITGLLYEMILGTSISIYARNHYPRAFNSIKSRTLLCTCISTRSRHHSHIFSYAPAGTLCAPEMEARDACICSLLILVCTCASSPLRAVAPSLRNPSALPHLRSSLLHLLFPSSSPLHHITFT